MPTCMKLRLPLLHLEFLENTIPRLCPRQLYNVLALRATVE